MCYFHLSIIGSCSFVLYIKTINQSNDVMGWLTFGWNILLYVVVVVIEWRRLAWWSKKFKACQDYNKFVLVILNLFKSWAFVWIKQLTGITNRLAIMNDASLPVGCTLKPCHICYHWLSSSRIILLNISYSKGRLPFDLPQPSRENHRCKVRAVSYARHWYFPLWLALSSWLPGVME